MACSELPTDAPVKQPDGSVQIILSEADAINIDACEHTLLQTLYPTLRETLSTHFRDVSKKALEHLNGGILVKNDRSYWVDGEIGRFEFCTYQVCEQDKTRYNTVGDVFAVLKCWEWYKTTGIKEISFWIGNPTLYKSQMFAQAIKKSNTDIAVVPAPTPISTNGDNRERRPGEQ